MGNRPRYWFRILAYGATLVVVLAVVTFAWLVHDIRSHLIAPPEVAGSGSILDYSEPPPPTLPQPHLAEKAGSLDLQQLATPGAAARPWTRWWWPGGDVTAQAACRQLAELHEQGFGGVEIQAFNAGLRAIEDQEVQARISSFGDDHWIATMTEFMDCARRLGILVYLNHLSGWPAGGAQVAMEDGLWTLRSAEAFVTGGSEIALDLPVPTPGVNDYLMALAEFFIDMELSSFAVEQRQLVSVLAAKVVGGARAANPLNATDTVELDPGSVHVLTDKVVEGELRWQAPAGNWVIIASYLMPSAEVPTLVAAQNPGYVIDHLDAEKLRAHYDFAYGRRTGLENHYGGPFVGFFNDSLEFKLDRLAATDIMQAFQERRGYDLAPHLPAVFVDARDNFFIRDVGRTRSAPSFNLDDNDPRIRHDYQLTLSDLVIERFIETSADWAARRKLLSRGQSYGLEMDVIRALGANHIPETEHLWGSSSEYVMKLAGAAGLLYDRPLVSAESFVWLKRAYAVTPRHIKAGADLLFLSGVNQVIYHGVPFVSDEPDYRDTFGWLGWYPFQGPGNPSGFSGNYGPTTPIWDALPELNEYITRSQNILQAGRPSVDLLVFYPFLGFPKSIEDSEVAGEALLFAGLLPGDPDVEGEKGPDLPFVKFLPSAKDPRVEWLERLIPTLRALDARGITWSWVNGHALESGRVEPDDYQALLVADVGAMSPETVLALDSLAGKGLDIAFLGELPAQQPGFHNHHAGDAQVLLRIQSLADGRRIENAEELAALIEPALAVTGSPAIRRVSRRGERGEMYHLLVNRSLEKAAGNVSVPAVGLESNAYWFDAASGAVWPAQQAPGGGYDLSLGSLESRFLLLTDETIERFSRPLSVTLEEAEQAFEVAGPWTMTAGAIPLVIEGQFQLVKELGYTDGEATELLYETNFEIADNDISSRLVLDLGTVSGVAWLELNGTRFAPKSFDPFLFDITGVVKQGYNQLRLRIVPPLRNSLISSQGLMDKELQQYRDQIGEVGLGGPVTISVLPSHRTGTND